MEMKSSAVFPREHCPGAIPSAQTSKRSLVRSGNTLEDFEIGGASQLQLYDFCQHPLRHYQLQWIHPPPTFL